MSTNVLLPGVIRIPHNNAYPLCFESPLNVSRSPECLQDTGIGLLIAFFRDKGLESLKEEDGREDWYSDWIDYQSTHGLYASLLSPRRYSSRGNQFDLQKLTRFVEVFAYFSPAHAYSLHVSFLGLSVILMSDNEPLKREAIARLEAGELFSLAVSERAHGADLLANEFVIHRAEDGTMVASGAKFYIGNSNTAGVISVLAKMVDEDQAGPTRRSAFAFFALRPQEASGLHNVKKIRTLGIRQAFVGEFDVSHHSVATGDMISKGHDAWNAVFATVNLGKFILGFGAVGSCSHAFAEAFGHMRRRNLYDKQVTDIPHVRITTAIAFARLTAMKLYANRALDYVQASCANDRRYLLFSAVQKSRVSTEGVKVMTLLSECVGAWGFEAETYFESALRDMQMIPPLESSTHINFELTARFIEPYFSAADAEATSSPRFAADVGENLYWMEARFRNFRTVRFANCLNAYERLRSVTNVGVFIEQVRAFSQFTAAGIRALSTAADSDPHIRLGRCLSVIAYAQLVAENCFALQTPLPLVSVIFQTLIEDLGEEAFHMASMFPAESSPHTALRDILRVPRTGAADFQGVSEFIKNHYPA